MLKGVSFAIKKSFLTCPRIKNCFEKSIVHISTYRFPDRKRWAYLG